MLLLRILAMLSLLMIGLIAGLFYAWVCTVMWGLDSIDPRIALQAMGAMNLSVQNAVFFPTFFLTPLVLLATAFIAWRGQMMRCAMLFTLAAVIYVVGAQMPTALVSVPMNRAMEALPVPQDIATAADIWRDYSARWQWWNTLRTIGSSMALLLTGWALLELGAERGSSGYETA